MTLICGEQISPHLPGEEGFRAYYEITDRLARSGAAKKHDSERVCDYMAPCHHLGLEVMGFINWE